MRLIDADYLLYEQGAIEVEEFAEAIANCPTVEQRHGHWIEEKTETGRKVYCSNCKHSAPFICVADDYYGTRMHGEIKKTKCCPDCGAKMDEVTE